MRDSRRIQERAQVRLDRRQVVWLTLGGGVSLALAFASGYGIGHRAARIGPEPPPADVLAQLEKDDALHDELTFYSRLTEGETPDLRRRSVRSPAGTRGAATSVRTQGGGSPGLEKPGAPVQTPKPERTLEPSEEPEPIRRALQRARQKAESSTTADGVRRALDAGPASPGQYTVQVSAFQSLGEAKAFSAGLERKGYKPFVVTASIPGKGTWYRVRLGSFSDEQTAQRAKWLLARADIPAWVLRAD